MKKAWKQVRDGIGLLADLLGISQLTFTAIGVAVTVGLSLIAMAVDISTKTVSLPFPIFIVLVTLAAYPIAKLGEWWMRRRLKQPFRYEGLNWNWKKSQNPFKSDLIPFCPHYG
jgi:hypothetical protein